MDQLGVDTETGEVGENYDAVMDQIHALDMERTSILQYLAKIVPNTRTEAAMLKAGAQRAATGENAVVVNSRRADIIVGPIGIVIADALLGEITPAMAAAVCQSGAKRVLVPINHCENYVVGVPDQPVSQLVAAAAQKVKELCSGIG